MDYDYEHEDDYAPRILWGRVAFFGVALVLAFAAGFCARGGGPTSELAERKQQVADLASENAVLEQRLEAAEAREGGGGGGERSGGGGGGGSGGGGRNTENDEAEESGEGQDAIAEEGETYVVESGDTLNGIAEQFYGDASKSDLITEANNLEGTDLQVGQELVIPPEE